MGRRHILERIQLVPRPRTEVWAFFSDPRNLEAITPDFLRFRVATPGPVAMIEGGTVDYRLSLFGIPFAWRSRFEEVRVGERFVDVQAKGPYRHWRHLHTFAESPGGTEVRDRVDYELPLGPFGVAAHELFVRRSLRRIFDHRRERVAALLGPSR
jgi:ligand-binding SRPBCC domain-containing protein